MVRNIVMPKMGLIMEEGTILEWKVSEGDSFGKGDVLCEIENNKATQEIVADFSGRIAKIVTKQEDTAKVGDPIAVAEENSRQ